MSSLDLPYREREINGTLYRASTLTLEEWSALTEHLAQIVGEPLSSVLRGDSTLPLGSSISGIVLEVIVRSVVGRITRARIMDIVGHMGKCLRAGDHILTSAQQSSWWPRHMKDFGPVVALFLEAQYSDFFDGVSSLLPLQEQDPLEAESD